VLAAWGEISSSPQLKELFNQFARILPPILGIVKAVVGTVWEIFSTGLGLAYAAVKTQLQAMWTAFEWLVDTVLPVVVGFVEGVVSAFQTYFPMAVEAVQGVIDGVIGIFSEIGSAISGVVQSIVATFSGIVSGVQEFIGAITAGFTSAETSVTGFMERATAAIMGVVAWVAYVTAPLVELVAWFGVQFGQIYALVADIFTRLVALILGKIASLVAIIMPYLLAVVQAFTSVWNGLVSITSAIFNSIVNAITSALSYIASVVTTGLAVVTSVFTSVWDSLSGIASAAMSAVGSAISTGLNMIVGYFTSLLQPIVAAVVSVFNEVKGAISAALAAIRGLIEGINFAALGRRLMQTLANGIKSGAMFPITAIKGVLSKVRAFLPGSDAEMGPLSDITASGQGMMVAMAAGIQQGTPDVEAQVNDSMSRIAATAAKGYQQTAEKLGDKELQREADRARELVAQRSFDNLDKISQMEQQAAEEIAFAQAHGQDVAAIEQYWREQIRTERERQNQQILADAERLAQEELRIQQEGQRAQQELAQQRVEFFSNLAGAFSALNEAAGGEIKALFALEKAASIASAIINTHQAVTMALASAPPPLNYALAVAVGAKGVAEIAAMAATVIALAEGGIVTSPTMALIGERGPEAVIPLDRMNTGGNNYSYTISFQQGIGDNPLALRQQARTLLRYINEEQAR
jgi:hypothetical protein